jgi:hypothetical protein
MTSGASADPLIAGDFIRTRAWCRRTPHGVCLQRGRKSKADGTRTVPATEERDIRGRCPTRDSYQLILARAKLSVVGARELEPPPPPPIGELERRLPFSDERVAWDHDSRRGEFTVDWPVGVRHLDLLAGGNVPQ